MSKNDSFEEMIHTDFKKKTLLKVNIMLFLFFGLITLLLIFIVISPPAHTPEKGPLARIIGIPDLWIWLILYLVIIPYLVTNIILRLLLSAYIRNFTFKVSEDNIVIEHGVFTRTKETIPYIRIQSINISSGFFDRRYKLYTLKISTAGSDRASSSINIFERQRIGYIPGLKEPKIIEDKINKLIKNHSQISGSLDDKIFKPEELAFDNFISYILSKMRESERFKTKIKELREKMNLSSAKLAEKVGVPIQTINYLEEGRYSPSLSLAYKIAEVLKCKIEDLFQLA